MSTSRRPRSDSDLRERLLAVRRFASFEAGGAQQHRGRATHCLVIVHVENEPAQGRLGESECNDIRRAVRTWCALPGVGKGMLSEKSSPASLARVNTEDSYTREFADEPEASCE